MEKFEVQLLISSHLGIKTWRKKIKAPHAILAGHKGVKRYWRYQDTHDFIVKGVVQRPGVPGPLSVYPFYEGNLGGMVSYNDLRAKWLSADELTPEQLEAWLDVSPEVDSVDLLPNWVEATRRGRQTPHED